MPPANLLKTNQIQITNKKQVDKCSQRGVGREEGARGKEADTATAVSSQQCRHASYTHTHTHRDQHTLLCVLSALCGLFLEKFSFHDERQRPRDYHETYDTKAEKKRL